MNKEFEKVSQAQLERMAYIDFRLDFFGEINRSDLALRFGIKEAAATRDITLYRAASPDNIEYDNQVRMYLRRKSYKALFPRTSEQTLTAINTGLGDNFTGSENTVISCESLINLGAPDITILSSVTRAIHQNKAIKINYFSLSSDESYREIVPHSLVDTGLRWHVRGFDRKNWRFADFVINRITEVDDFNSEVNAQERIESDIDWNTLVKLALVPHPQLHYVEGIKKEYNMTGDSLKITVRSALAGYILRRWNIDCSPDHHLKGAEYHLWLKNSEEVSMQSSLNIAPGYTKY